MVKKIKKISTVLAYQTWGWK